jgi:NDP-sugar pyrophosphorylase family protein
MIDRLIRIFSDNNAEEIIVIVNNLTSMVQEHIKNANYPVPVKLVVKTTPSSMHSFYELSKFLGEGKFCLTTVDTIFKEQDFTEYINAFESSDKDGLMAVTDYIDDEKPLYVSTDKDMFITGFHDSLQDFEASSKSLPADSVCRYISGGIYCLDHKAIDVLDKCIQSGMSRMRNFQRQLVKEGLVLKAFPLSKILDVDHVTDIEKANKFLLEK